MEKNYLLLSLGHNSSAIFVDNSDPKQQKIIGYEQERLSGIKADSQFPRDAINEITKHVESDKMRNCKVLISHWFNFGPHIMSNKYITQNDIDWLHYICGDDIQMCEKDFTHHDAHAYSAYEFFKYHKDVNEVDGDIMCLVVDGFGNNEEVLSLYSTDKTKGIHLVHRVFGYEASLGLMYQFATAYTGMKENQDEYKFLGYEAHIDEFMDNEQIDILDNCVEMNKEKMISLFGTNTNKQSIKRNIYDDIIDYEHLDEVRNNWYNVFDEVLVSVNAKDTSSYVSRCIIAYFIQHLCENTLVAWLNSIADIKNLIVVGGVFYNVKLNQAIAEKCAKNHFSVMPLAGDQGAAIGLYAKVCDKQFEFGDLCWGKRRFYNAEKLVKQNKNSRLIYVKAKSKKEISEIKKTIAKCISDNNIVNVVIGNMEFGPRALCHTSTLFLPTRENTDCNNVMNGRNEVMPCAPVCKKENAEILFGKESIEKVIGSDKYMICTHTYNKPFSNHYGGVMHKRPLEDNYTGRPQIVDKDHFMYDVLDLIEKATDYKAIVNTSFNVHGRPIVFDIVSILQNYEYQCENAELGKEPYLFIIETT